MAGKGGLTGKRVSKEVIKMEWYEAVEWRGLQFFLDLVVKNEEMAKHLYQICEKCKHRGLKYAWSRECNNCLIYHVYKIYG